MGHAGMWPHAQAACQVVQLLNLKRQGHSSVRVHAWRLLATSLTGGGLFFTKRLCFVGRGRLHPCGKHYVLGASAGAGEQVVLPGSAVGIVRG